MLGHEMFDFSPLEHTRNTISFLPPQKAFFNQVDLSDRLSLLVGVAWKLF